MKSSGWKIDGLGVRLGIGILVVGQSMIFGLALNLHEDVPPDVRWFAQTLIMAATFLVVALLGGPLFRAAWQELRRGRLTLEAMFLLTMTGALAASLQAHITGRGKIYFEVVSVLLVVYTLGKVIGSRSRSAALASSRAWAEQLSTCRLVDAKGRTRTMPVAEVLPGDLIEVFPGEAVAVDGVIREGIGFISEAAVNGEPFAVVRRPGDQVLAGAASYDATFRIEATVKGTERQVDRLLAAVEQARDRPVSFQAQADRLGRAFFPLIVLIALGTFGYWTFLTASGWETGLFNAMSVLLVACPCAIGLATPIVIWSALGKLAERGLIVRAGDAIERLAEIDHVMLDKTGTLTDDSFTLLDIATFAIGDERAKLLGWLAIIQGHSQHPIAKPFARLPHPFAPGAEPRVVSLHLVPGRGVEAEIETADGTRHIIQICRSGCARLSGTDRPTQTLSGTDRPTQSYEPTDIGYPAASEKLAAQLRATGHRIDVAVDDELVAVAVLAEQLRDSALEAIDGFQQLGLKVEVITGDSAERASIWNLPSVRGGLLPSDKHAAVEAAKAADAKTLFVGDGINDAAALGAAHAGIALSSGTDIANGAATITLYHHDLRVLPWSIELSREAVRAVRRNLYRALAYNLIGTTLAACGVLHPVVAAVLMVASSLMLIFSSTRVGIKPSHCLTSGATEPLEVNEFLQAPTRPARQTKATEFMSPVPRAIGHGVAFALQGVVFLLLLDSARELPVAIPIVGAFAIIGLALGYLWYRWTAMPHLFDMCVGMLTFGNLGMLIGWWADNDFTSLPDGGCSHCIEAMREGTLRPWMWLGMLVGANAALVWFRRCVSFPNRSHSVAMFTGGNIGMVVGMLGGSWCAAQVSTDSVLFAVGVSFVGMTIGMIAGMLLGTWLVEKMVAIGRTIPKLPHWFRSGVTDTAG